MPSCVVKCCKNNTTHHKKGQGITFHRFPVGNEPWKNDWINIIRNCRREVDWNPSKTSVICSEHFAPNDLYSTSKGRRRLITFAIPKLHLSKRTKEDEEPSKSTLIQPSGSCKALLLSTRTPLLTTVEAVTKDPEQLSKPCPSLLSAQAPLPGRPITLETVPVEFEKPYKPCTSLTLPQTPLIATAGAGTDDSEQHPASSSSTQASVPENLGPVAVEFKQPSPMPSTSDPMSPPVSFDSEPLLMWDVAKKQCLNNLIKGKEMLLRDHEYKIEKLNQTLKRLQKQNKILKVMIKSSLAKLK